MLNFKEFIEAVNYKAGTEVVIHKGEVLYHGTGESFDTRTPRPGGYDNVFWTTDDFMIARTKMGHIPLQTSTTSLKMKKLSVN